MAIWYLFVWKLIQCHQPEHTTLYHTNCILYNCPLSCPSIFSLFVPREVSNHEISWHMCPDRNVHVAHMGPTCRVLSAPGRPHVGPMNLSIRVSYQGHVSVLLICIYRHPRTYNLFMKYETTCMDTVKSRMAATHWNVPCYVALMLILWYPIEQKAPCSNNWVQNSGL